MSRIKRWLLAAIVSALLTLSFAGAASAEPGDGGAGMQWEPGDGGAGMQWEPGDGGGGLAE